MLSIPNKTKQNNKKKIYQDNSIDYLPLIEGTEEKLVDINKTTGKVENWNEKKQLNIRYADLLNRAKEEDKTLISDNRLEDVYQCASYLEYKVYKDRSKKLHRAFFCGHRYCPMCNWRRSKMMYGQITRITNRLKETQPKARYIFLTLTIKNCKGSELKATIQKMNDAYRKMLGGRRFAPANKLKKNILGSLRITEVTINRRANTYHPHFHIILCVKPSYFGKDYHTKDNFINLWQQALGVDYKPSIDVQVISTKERKNAIAEVSKYPIKHDYLFTGTTKALEEITTLIIELKRMRFISFFGIFKDIRKELKLEDIESKNANLIHVDNEEIDLDNPVARIMYGFNVKAGYYIN